MGNFGTEKTETAIAKFTNVVEDVRAKAEDGLTGQEIFQLVVGNSDEAIWIAMNWDDIANELGELEGNIQEGETADVAAKFIDEYDAESPEEEYMVERIVIAILAIRDAYNAVTDWIDSKDEPEA